MQDDHFRHLLLLIQEGEGAREQLIEFVRAYLRRLAGERSFATADDERSDLVQDSAVIVVRALSSFRGQSLAEFLAWLRDILSGRVTNAHRDATRQCRDRRRNVALESVVASLASAETPSEIAEHTEDAERFRCALERLPRKQRLVFALRVEARLPWREIAELLGDETERSVQVFFRDTVADLKLRLREHPGR